MNSNNNNFWELIDPSVDYLPNIWSYNNNTDFLTNYPYINIDYYYSVIREISPNTISNPKTNQNANKNLNLLPTSINLYQNFPNPFNPHTKIQYDLPYSCDVTLKIFNTLGQTIKILFSGYKDSGKYTISWDGKLKNGMSAPSGVYFYQIQIGINHVTKKMLLVR